MELSDLQKWDRRFLDLANHLSTWSKDPSTKVGCVVVGEDREIRTTGFNGFPRGIKDDKRLLSREEKYPIIVHAEENAVAQAARIGSRLLGCTAYTTFPPCSKCARLFIQAGLAECVWPDQEIPERWKEDMDRARNLMQESGMVLRAVKPEAKQSKEDAILESEWAAEKDHYK